MRTPTVDKSASRREDDCSLPPALRSNCSHGIKLGLCPEASSHVDQMKNVLLAMSSELIDDAPDLSPDRVEQLRHERLQLKKQIQLLENLIRDKGTPKSRDASPRDENMPAIIYSALRKLRTLFVKECADGVMAYHIFGNATLQQMSIKIPRTKEELLEIPGLGEAKVLKYGDRLLETIQSTVNEYHRTNKKDSVINKDSPDSEKRRRDENNSPNGESPLTSGEQTTLPLPTADAPPRDENMPAIMYSALRKLRTRFVKESANGGIMAYHIFGNATLQQMSVRIPRTKEELLEIPGLGEAKVLKYGDRLLETIESTVNEYHGTKQKDYVINKDSPNSRKRRRDENISRTEH